jgi:integrase
VGRKPNGASSIYLGGDGHWHGRVTVGIKNDGRPDRRHVMGKTEAEVIRKVRELERARDDGNVRKAGQRWTVAKWLTHWIENIALPPAIRESSHASYRADVSTHLIPGIGAHRLDRLTPEHLEQLYARMQATGSSPGDPSRLERRCPPWLHHAQSGRARQGAHSRRRRDRAVRRRRGEAPAGGGCRVAPQQRAVGRRSRSGTSAERGTLGLRWPDIDLDRGILRVRRGRQRPRYAHGCGGRCGRKPGYCPARRQFTPDASQTKSTAGRRTIGLPTQLVARLRAHRDEQAREQERAGELWHEGGWVFATPTGEPLNPNTDYHQWKELLKAAGLREGRLHDARHTAATVLLVLGVPERTVMGIMGWSSTGMTRRYQHVTDAIRQAVAEQVDGLLWGGSIGGAGEGDGSAADAN